MNGGYSEAESIPQQFVNILCEGPTDGMDPKRRELTIHGFVLLFCKGLFQKMLSLRDWTGRDKIWRRQLPDGKKEG